MGKIYCQNCSKKCVGDVLKVGDKYFHQICFKCKDCNVNLDAGGFYFRNDNYYCPIDYTNRFSNKCFICSKLISSEVVSALNHHFHKDCFKCNECNSVFAPGNRVTMRNDKFICSYCSNGTDKLSTIKKNSIPNSNGIYDKTIVESQNREILSDDTTTDQGYISADPTSLSSPTQAEDDLKTQSLKEVISNDIKSQSFSTRSMFDFGKFYKSSYLDIQEKQQKERQVQLKKTSQSYAKIFFSNNIQKSKSSKRPNKLPYGDIGAILCGNKFSTSSSLKVVSSMSEADINEKENVIRLASYPSGEKHPENIPYPIERDDWPAPLSSDVLLQEKKQRKQIFFGRSVQSELDQLPEDGVFDFTQSLDHLAMIKSQNNPKGLLEVINSSPKRNNGQILNYDVISASRSPSASIEPVSKPRFSNHFDKSKSRDSTYFNNPDRHYGYSLDFISSTSRPFLVGKEPFNMYGKPANKNLVPPVVKLKPGYTKGLLHDLKVQSMLKRPDFEEKQCVSSNNNNSGLQNGSRNKGFTWIANRTMSDTFDVQLKTSEDDLTFDEEIFDSVDELSSSDFDLVTGLKSTKNRYLKERLKDQTLTSGRSSINSRIESFETWSFWSHKPISGAKPPVIPYSDLVSKDSKILKYLDVHKLENYLSDEEFRKLFKLNRPDFYRLPEWKQNDLKRRINLF